MAIANPVHRLSFVPRFERAEKLDTRFTLFTLKV